MDSLVDAGHRDRVFGPQPQFTEEQLKTLFQQVASRATRLQPLIERAGLPTFFPEHPGLFDRIIRAMQMDKKFREGKNVFVLPTGVGSWQQAENVDWALVHEAVRGVLA